VEKEKGKRTYSIPSPGRSSWLRGVIILLRLLLLSPVVCCAREFGKTEKRGHTERSSKDDDVTGCGGWKPFSKIGMGECPTPASTG